MGEIGGIVWMADRRDELIAAWRFGEFLLDMRSLELTRGNTPVRIEPQSLKILEFLLQSRDRVVSKDDLVAHIW